MEKISITSSIKRARVVITFLLGIIILKENCTILQLIFSIILIILSIIIAKSETMRALIRAQKEKRFFILGVCIFNGTSSFLNKIYVADYQNPLYVVFTFAIATVIGVLIYCLLTNQWNYIDIRKINNKNILYYSLYWMYHHLYLIDFLC